MRILCYGDSNTYGWDPRDYLGIPYARPWPVVLEECIGAEVISMGEPGREIPGGRDRALLLSSIDKLQPDILMILLGTNDLLNHPTRAVGQIAEKMKNLIADVRSHFRSGTVVLMSPPNMAEELDPGHRTVQQLTEAYQKIADGYGDGTVVFFDAAGLELPLAFDGIHLTEAGHALLAEQISGSVFSRGWECCVTALGKTE